MSNLITSFGKFVVEVYCEARSGISYIYLVYIKFIEFIIDRKGCSRYIFGTLAGAVIYLPHSSVSYNLLQQQKNK